jgi:hypothetical protein
VSAWEGEDDAAHSPGDFERWMSIDHTYCRTVQLFDEATMHYSRQSHRRVQRPLILDRTTKAPILVQSSMEKRRLFGWRS